MGEFVLTLRRGRRLPVRSFAFQSTGIFFARACLDYFLKPFLLQLDFILPLRTVASSPGSGFHVDVAPTHERMMQLKRGEVAFAV